MLQSVCGIVKRATKAGLYCFPKKDEKEIGTCIPKSAFRVESPVAFMYRPDVMYAYVDEHLRMQMFLDVRPREYVDDEDNKGPCAVIDREEDMRVFKDHVTFYRPTIPKVASLGFHVQPEAEIPRKTIDECVVWAASDRKLTQWNRVGLVGSLEPRENWRSFDIEVDFPVYGLRIESPIPEVVPVLDSIQLNGHPFTAAVAVQMNRPDLLDALGRADIAEELRSRTRVGTLRAKILSGSFVELSQETWRLAMDLDNRRWLLEDVVRAVADGTLPSSVLKDVKKVYSLDHIRYAYEILKTREPASPVLIFFETSGLLE